MTQAPIEDAVTVAYIGTIHALGEVYEALTYKNSMGMMARQALEDALADLINVRDMLKPHVRAREPRSANKLGLVGSGE